MNYGENTTDRPEFVRSYCKIGVDRTDECWRATPFGVPEPAGFGDDAVDAIRQLFETEPKFDIDRIIALNDATRDGHLEYIITLIERKKSVTESIPR